MKKKYSLETRGGANKRKNFTWWYNKERGILNIENEEGLFHRFLIDEIFQILNSLKSEFGEDSFPLANNVEKLSKGTEVKGLGTIILYHSPKDIFHAQGASYFGPVLEHIGFFEWNGKNRGIQWRLVNQNITKKAVVGRVENSGLRDNVIIQRVQNCGLRDPEETRLYNIVDMGLTFSAMIRLYEEGTKQTLLNKILEELTTISKITSKKFFEKIHSDFCEWGTQNLILAEKTKAEIVIKKKGEASYGQVAKTLDVVLKVVVYYCHWPNPEKAKRLEQWLHAAVDTKMMKFLKEKYPKYFPSWPSSVENVDETIYLELQELVLRFIRDEHDGKILPVQFDDIYWNILNRKNRNLQIHYLEKMDTNIDANSKNHIRESVQNCNLCIGIDQSGALCIRSKEIGLKYNHPTKMPINILFIAESPPSPGKGFFYDKFSINTKFRDKLFFLINEAGLGKVEKIEDFTNQGYYLADTINCRWDSNIKNYISREIIKKCSVYLVEQIKLFRPRFIVAMGNAAKYSLNIETVRRIIMDSDIQTNHIIEMAFPLTAASETDKNRINKLNKIAKIINRF